MGYKRQKLWYILWFIFDQNEGDIFVKQWDLFRKTMGYSGQKLRDILG